MSPRSHPQTKVRMQLSDWPRGGWLLPSCLQPPCLSDALEISFQRTQRLTDRDDGHERDHNFVAARPASLCSKQQRRDFPASPSPPIAALTSPHKNTFGRTETQRDADCRGDAEQTKQLLEITHTHDTQGQLPRRNTHSDTAKKLRKHTSILNYTHQITIRQNKERQTNPLCPLCEHTHCLFTWKSITGAFVGLNFSTITCGAMILLYFHCLFSAVWDIKKKRERNSFISDRLQEHTQEKKYLRDFVWR